MCLASSHITLNSQPLTSLNREKTDLVIKNKKNYTARILKQKFYFQDWNKIKTDIKRTKSK